MEIQHFQILLEQLLSPNNEERRAAEASFSQFRDNAPDQTVIALGLILRGEFDSGIQQLAANLLKKLLLALAINTSVWKKITNETKQHIQSCLIQVLQIVQRREILRAVCDLAATLAISLLSTDKQPWQELFALLNHWAGSNEEQKREASLDITCELLRSCSRYLQDNFGHIEKLLFQALYDNSIRVRLAGFKCLLALFGANPSVSDKFQPLTPNLFEIVSVTLDKEEELSRDGISLLIDLAENFPDFFRSHVDAALEETYKWLTNFSLEEATRYQSAEFIATLAESKPSFLRKRIPFLSKIVEVYLHMMSQIEENSKWNLGEEHDCEDEECAIAGNMLDRLSLNIGEPLVPVVFSRLPTMLQSNNWTHRHAAITVVSLVGEGCAHVLSSNLGELVQSVLGGIYDSHERVRWAGCNAIGQMSTDFSPELQTNFHESILQALVYAMDDNANPRVQSHAAAAIINFCDGCEKEILEPYLSPLLGKLVQILQTENIIIIEQAITAVAAVADCIGSSFFRFYDQFIPYLKSILFAEAKKELSKVRGKTIEAISIIAAAVGAEKFTNDANQILKFLLSIDVSSLPSDDPQISFLSRAWGRFSKSLGKDFAPYLPHLMPRLLSQAKQTTKPRIFYSDKEIEENGEDYNLIATDQYTIGIPSADISEKNAALGNIYCIATELQELYIDYVPESLNVCLESIEFFYDEEVRTWAATILPVLLACYKECQPLAATQQIFHSYLNNLLQAIAEELDVEVTITMLDALQESIATAGVGCLQDSQIPLVYSVCKKVLDDFTLRRNALLSRMQDPECDSEDKKKLENASDKQNEIFYKIVEVFGKCIETHGEKSLQYLKDIHPHIKRYLEEYSRPAERQTAICLFDDLVEFGTIKAAEIYQSWVPLVMKFVQDPNEDVRQAAIYGMGVLAQYNPELFKHIIMEVWTLLDQVISSASSRKKANVHATENAIAAIGKILQHHSSSINMAQYLPIWLNYLPVSEDEETVTIYEQFCMFFSQYTQIMLGENFSNLPKLLAIFAEVLGTPLINKTTEHNILRILHTMQAEFPAEVLRSAFGSLSQIQQQKLQQVSS